MDEHTGHRERKKQQFLDYGLDAFADHEVLELLLYYAIPRRDTNQLAHRLLDHFGSLHAVFSASPDTLCQVSGIGMNTAALIHLVPQVYRRARISLYNNETILDTTERIGEFFVNQFVAEPKEILYQLCLDAKGRMLSCRKVSEGDAGSVNLNLRKIVENAICCNAVLVALAHNHPSGVAFPSHEDKVVTVQVRDALDAVHIRLVDHIIVADTDYISLRDEGII